MEHTPRNIVLQLGALIALYLSVSFFLTLVFGLINVAYPIASDSSWEIESASNNIRLGIAMVIVFFPTYLLLTRQVNRYRRKENGAYQNVTRWLVYLSLLVAGLVLLVSLVTTIYTFLNGDITTRFILKAGSVVGIIGLTFNYYLQDLRGFWITHESRSLLYGGLVSAVVLLTMLFGFINIETPAQVRELKLDEQQLNDLRSIQWDISAYLQNSSTTPSSLDELYTDSSQVLEAPEGRDAYTYAQTDNGFELCATFSRDYRDELSRPGPDFRPNRAPGDSSLVIINAEDWNYDQGRYCFKRTVR